MDAIKRIIRRYPAKTKLAIDATAELASLQAIVAEIEQLRIYIGNPSAWEHYDDKMSERLRVLVELAALEQEQK